MASTTVVTPTSAPGNVAPRSQHLGFLDGIRGFTSLYVALFHYSHMAYPVLPYGNIILRTIQAVFSQGPASVAIFIVLSGYCLMLPVARTADFQLQGGVSEYLKRRARRILPPYYAAIGITVMIYLGHYLRELHRGGNAAKHLVLLTKGNLISHLLLIHNLDEKYITHLDAPTWSVAVEWQIYFLLPLVFLPVLRRFGAVWLLLAALILGLGPHILLPNKVNFDWSHPWFIILFAMGNVMALLTNAGGGRAVAPWQRPVWLWSCIASLLISQVVPASGWMRPGPGHGLVVLQDLLLGLAAACFIGYCALCSDSGVDSKTSFMFRLLNSRVAASLAAYSYSLYLIHVPIIIATEEIWGHMHLSPDLSVLLFPVRAAVMLTLAYGFYICFERPFLRKRARMVTT